MRVFILFCLITFNQAVLALTQEQVPEPLKPWIDWAIDEDKDFQCPFLYHRFKQKQCRWPGRLQLTLNESGGHFSSRWTLYRDAWVILPGDDRHWPQKVRVNQKPLPVVKKNGKPAVFLSAGQHHIEGQFRWRRLPDRLGVYADTGLIALQVNGKTRFDYSLKQGSIWLHQSKKAGQIPPENRLQLQVFRKLIDDVPLQMETVLQLDVAGKPREVLLSYALLAGFIAADLNSPLPARLENSGKLRIQLRPGQWTIRLKSLNPENIKQLGLTFQGAAWPEYEIWSFQPNRALRLLEIKNVPAVDPSQTRLPANWRQLPAYRLEQGDVMVFKVLRRGNPQPEPDHLTLRRRIWLDFAGTGYTIQDGIQGQLRRSWRLQTGPEMQLGQVKINGKNQLITRLHEQESAGVEVRQGHLNLLADSRIEGNLSDLSVSGWQHDFQQASAELNIPPGWRLFYVGGVDNQPDSWTGRWTLLDFFVVLISALAVSRLWNKRWGALALLMLVLTTHESGAPHFIWLNLLAVIALLRVLPESGFARLLRYYRHLSWLAMLIILIPFTIQQVRTAFYPQLEKPWQPVAPQIATMDSLQVASPHDTSAALKGTVARLSARALEKSRGGSATNKDKQMPLTQFDPNANLQTGPGLPQWQWHKTQLAWNGQVDSRQRLQLWFLSPGMMFVWKWAQLLLIIALVLRLLDVVRKSKKGALSGIQWMLILPLLFGAGSDSFADLPDQKLLQELKSRLLQAPECLPDCAQITRMKLVIGPEKLAIDLTVHVQHDTAIPLPAQAGQWMPGHVKLDDQESQVLMRDKNSLLWAFVPAGIHQLQLTGISPRRDKFSLPLTLKPHHVETRQHDWKIQGVYSDGQSDNVLQFSRLQRTAKSPESRLQPSELPAFIRIERTLNLGLDWRISTRLVRLNNSREAVHIRYPLLAGESVTSAGIRVNDHQAELTLASGQRQLIWQSILEKQDNIELKAAQTRQWTELWRARISPVWHVELSGIAVIQQQNARGEWLPEWRPWPGERVLLSIGKPQAVAGATLTIDESTIKIKPGKRTEQAAFTMRVRSSKAQQHIITLPPQAELQSVLIDGRRQPIRQQGRELRLPIRPGEQSIALNWVTPAGIAPIYTTPAIDLKQSSVNHHINLQPGQDRWILLTLGPDFGPATLIWGIVIVLAVLAFGLGQSKLTPLKPWQWFLLLLGLSQVPVVAGVCVVLWLLALGIRGKANVLALPWFNFIQICLGMLTFTALALLFIAVQRGLLGIPDMQIAGNQSSAFNLNWYQDRNPSILPVATIISVPLLVYRGLMLLWSLWLAHALLNWLQWGWQCFSAHGLWKKAAFKPKKPLVVNESTEKNHPGSDKNH